MFSSVPNSVPTLKRRLKVYLNSLHFVICIHGGKQREKITDGLVNWLGAGKVVKILKAKRDRGIWKDMIAKAIKHGTG